MTQNPSIASVTLAYNSEQFLPQHLEALRRQSRSLDEIIIVDNGSNDGTRQLLREQYPQVKLLDFPSNLGVGGGYTAGLTYAGLERMHDWVWLLDQDSVPAIGALESLLNALRSLGKAGDDIGILAPTISHSGTGLTYSGMLWRSGLMRPPAKMLDQPMYYADATISSGSLIRREVIEKVGLPRADFFIDFVDVEYCLRIRRHGYKIAIVRDSQMSHAIGNPRITKILGISKAWGGHPPWREYYMSRNETYTIWHLYPTWKSKLSVFRRLLRHAAAILVFGEGRLASLKMVLLGFLDGRAGRLETKFRPENPTGSHKESAEAVLNPAPKT